MPKTPSERQLAYVKRKPAAGFVLVSAWVRADQVQTVKNFIAALKGEKP